MWVISVVPASVRQHGSGIFCYSSPVVLNVPHGFGKRKYNFAENKKISKICDFTIDKLRSGCYDVAVSEKFEDRKKLRLDDVAATQAVICVLAAAALFVTNLLYPDTAQAFFEKLRHCMTDSTYILPNPVDSIISYLQSR